MKPLSNSPLTMQQAVTLFLGKSAERQRFPTASGETARLRDGSEIKMSGTAFVLRKA